MSKIIIDKYLVHAATDERREARRESREVNIGQMVPEMERIRACCGCEPVQLADGSMLFTGWGPGSYVYHVRIERDPAEQDFLGKVE